MDVLCAYVCGWGGGGGGQHETVGYQVRVSMCGMCVVCVSVALQSLAPTTRGQLDGS